MGRTRTFLCWLCACAAPTTRQLDPLLLNTQTDAPDAKESRLAVAKARYAELKEGAEGGADGGGAQAGPLPEQERWEREQLARTRLGVGVASAQADAAAADAAKYELLFEDQIEYVKVRTGGGGRLGGGRLGGLGR